LATADVTSDFHSSRKKDLRPRPELEAEASAALEEARTMPLGLERTEAMKKTGILRNAADLQPLFFAKIRENVSAYRERLL